jgi:hypothetical protein
VDFDATGQLLIIYCAFVKYLRENGDTMKQLRNNLQTSRKSIIQLRGKSCIILSWSFVSP